MTDAQQSGSKDPRETLPVQARMTAERGLMTAIVMLIAGAFWAVNAAGRVLGGEEVWFVTVVSAVLAALFIGQGIQILRVRAKRIAACEADYGPDAGRQRPV